MRASGIFTAPILTGQPPAGQTPAITNAPPEAGGPPAAQIPGQLGAATTWRPQPSGSAALGPGSAPLVPALRPHAFLDTLAVTQQTLGSIHCERPKGWLLIRCSHGSTIYKPLRCRHCNGCLTYKTSLQIARLAVGLQQSTDIAFLTLTSLPHTDWTRMMKAWTSFCRMLRKHAPALQYAAVKEAGPKTGMKHLHVIITNAPFIPWQTLSAAWKARTGAWNVSIQRVNGPSAIRYITKHSWKGFVHGRKNITYSQHWPPLTSTHPITDCQTLCGPPTDRLWQAVMPDGTHVEFLAPDCNCWPQITQEVQNQCYHPPPAQPNASRSFPSRH